MTSRQKHKSREKTKCPERIGYNSMPTTITNDDGKVPQVVLLCGPRENRLSEVRRHFLFIISFFTCSCKAKWNFLFFDEISTLNDEIMCVITIPNI
jgi:hypothetical protein